MEFKGYCRASNGNVSRSLEYLKRFIFLLVVVFLFFNTIPGTTTIKEVSFYGSLMLALFVWVVGKEEVELKSPLTIVLFFYCCWASLTLFWTLDVGQTMHDIRAHLIKYVVFYFIFFNFVRTKKMLLVTGGSFVASSLLMSIYLINRHIIDGLGVFDKMGSYFSELPVNWVGYSVVVSIAIVFVLIQGEKNRWYYRCGWGGVLAIFYSIIMLTQSRATTIAAIIVSLLSIANNKKVAIPVFVLFFAILVGGPVHKRFGVDGIVNDARVVVNLTSVEIMKDYPFGVGYGIEIYGKHLDLDKYNKRVEDKFKMKKVLLKDPHSILFSIGVRLGVVGLALFVAVLTKFLLMCLRMIRQKEDDFSRTWSLAIVAGFAGFMIIAFCEPATSHLVDTIFYTLLAMGACVWRLHEQSQVVTSR